MRAIALVRGICTLLLITAIGCAGREGSNTPSGESGSTANLEPQLNGPTYSCDLHASVTYCQEYTKVDPAAVDVYRSACSDNGGIWSETPCSRSYALGGCQTTFDILTITDWFYANGPYTDTDAFAQSCTSDGNAVYVVP